MSSFLQQLKSGGFEIDNRKGADATGCMTRRIEKRFVGEPFEKLGLRLSDDAEVVEVTKGSLAAKANVPCHFIIFDVNGEFIESRNDLITLVNTTQSLNLVIKMQSVGPISELIAMTIRDDENRETNLAAPTADAADGKKPAAPPLDYDELLRTTPRFSFLSVSHPLFRRYNNRLQEKREAVALVRRRTQETEEQLRRERSEVIRREMEAAAEEERKKKKQAEEERITEEKARAAAEAAAAAAAAQSATQDSFIKVVNDESSFASLGASGGAAVPHPPTSAPKTPEPVADKEEKRKQPTEESTKTDDTVSAAELLSLIGVPTSAPEPTAAAAAPSTSILGVGNPSKGGIVTCVTLPTEEYTLSTGEKVVCILKKRSGPIPNPPPGSPPRAKRIGGRADTTPGEKSMKRPRD